MTPPHRPALAAVSVAFALAISTCGSGEAAGPSTNREHPGPSSSFTPPTFPSFPTPTAVDSSEPPGSPSPSETPTEPELSCPSRALLGVYEPQRFHVLARCRWFVGIVQRIVRLRDGGVQVDVAPAGGYGRFLDLANRSLQHGQLVTEIMAGQAMLVFLPEVGERIAVFGTWVRNVGRGWNEIHPIWEIEYLDSGTTIYATPPDPPLYDPSASP